jgi:hypothetical protein
MSKPKYKCECYDGYEYFEEGGGQVRDTCYKCNGSGLIDRDTYRLGRIRSLAEELAVAEVNAAIARYNMNEDGEGWDFMAAESGCSSSDYTSIAMESAAGNLFCDIKAVDKEYPRLVSALLTRLSPESQQYPVQED